MSTHYLLTPFGVQTGDETLPHPVAPLLHPSVHPLSRYGGCPPALCHVCDSKCVMMLLLHPVLIHLEIVSLYCIIVCVTEGHVLFAVSLNVNE